MAAQAAGGATRFEPGHKPAFSREIATPAYASLSLLRLFKVWGEGLGLCNLAHVTSCIDAADSSVGLLLDSLAKQRLTSD